MNDTKKSINTKDNTDDESSIFFTTSDLLKTINNVIKETSNEEQGNDLTQGSTCSEGFELQRRMPDGSTRKADESDIELADFQSKMKQVSEEEIYRVISVDMRIFIFVTV